MNKKNKDTKWKDEERQRFLENIVPLSNFINRNGTFNIIPLLRQSLPAIEILFLPDQIKGPDQVFNKVVASVSPFWPSDVYIKGKVKDWPHLLDAINKDRKSIILRVNLERKREQIQAEFSNLLTIILREIKRQGIERCIIKDRDFVLYWMVYDLHENKRWTFPKIARKVFPQDFRLTQNGGKEESAITKVKQIHREVRRLIEGKSSRSE